MCVTITRSKMYKKLNILCLLASLVSCTLANYNGPFILWGRDELKKIELSALEGLDDTILRNIYSESPAIILFVRNASSRFNEENFPTFKELLEKNKYVYLTQHWLPSDPLDFNVNAEVINLVGPPLQQDVELSALFNDAELTYGSGKVLGILATKTTEHELHKRAVVEEESTTANPSTTPAPTEPGPEPIFDEDEDYVYYPTDALKNQTGNICNILMHTRSAPVLMEGKTRTVLGDKRTMITTNRGKFNNCILKVRYNNQDKLSVEYIFNIGANGYWTLQAAEVGNNTRLEVVGEKPTAPLGFSYKCAKPLLFRNGSITLRLNNIQAQPNLRGKRFDSAIDCVGFTTAPIWSAIFVCFILGFVMAIGINCLLEIKPPNRFENSRSKQLTFTIQE